MNEINLGVSEKEHMDAMMNGMPMKVEEKGEDIRYPSFHYCGPIELDLPDHGEMEIHFRKTSETSKVLEDGSHWYECDIQVRKILDVEAEEPKAPTQRNNGTEAALDRLAKALENNHSEDSNNDESGY